MLIARTPPCGEGQAEFRLASNRAQLRLPLPTEKRMKPRTVVIRMFVSNDTLKSKAGRSAFSLIEVMIVVVVLGVLIAILLPVVGNARRSAASVECQSHLHDLSVAFEMFTSSNGDFFPDEMSGAWDDLLLEFLATEEVFECPADPDFEKTKLSYNWRDTFTVGDPSFSLAGRSKSAVRRTDLVLVFDSLPDWHEKNKINAATIAATASAYSLDDFDKNMQSPVQGVGGGLFDFPE